jgi:hypothetical protein
MARAVTFASTSFARIPTGILHGTSGVNFSPGRVLRPATTKLGKKELALISERNPRGRVGELEAITDAVLLLVSPAAIISGQSLIVDGGGGSECRLPAPLPHTEGSEASDPDHPWLSGGFEGAKQAARKDKRCDTPLSYSATYRFRYEFRGAYMNDQCPGARRPYACFDVQATSAEICSGMCIGIRMRCCCCHHVFIFTVFR